MKKFIGIVGSGMVGRDPFDPKCWSRSGYSLFTKLRGKDWLARAFGVEVPHPLRGLLMLKNFHPTRKLWSQRLNLDPVYYGALTREIEKALRPEDFQPDNVLLQIGGHYNSSRASGGRIPAYSYNDGTIAGMMTSPFFPKVNLPYARRAFDYEKGVYHDMTKMFVMAEYWKRSFVENFGVKPERVINIGFGVNLSVPDLTGKDYSRKEIVFVGIDFSRKGGENLIAAFKLLRDKHPGATLHLVGPHAPPPELADIGSSKVVFHGHLSRENPAQMAKLLELFALGTLFVLPSLYEPFGNAGLEALLYGMPVIATRDWSFPDFVTPETGLLLDDPKNVRELADKMDAFLGDPDRCARAGKAGRELVLSRYTWDKVVERLQHEVSTP